MVDSDGVKRSGTSIVIVNFNGRGHLERCLPAVARTVPASVEVVVVDNASSDGSVAWLRQFHPEVRVLALEANFGFGEANRRGAEVAAGEWIVFLNNDTEPTPGWLVALQAAFEADTRVGAACATLELMHHPGILNARGGGMTWLGFGHDVGFGRSVRPTTDEPPEPAYRDTLFPTAAAMLIGRDLFTSSGGFDPRMFMYHEDVDLGWRLWLLGRRVVVCRDSVVRHAFGGTTCTHGGRAWSTRMGFRHNVRALLKNYAWPHAIAAAALFSGLLLARLQMRLLWHVWSWNLRMLPDTLRARRQVQRARQVSDRMLFECGLIDRHRLFPAARPELPVHGVVWGRANWVVSGHLDPAGDSAHGRLGCGWFPVHRRHGELLRTIDGAASCYLRVAPGACGRLSVTCRHDGGAQQSPELTLTCNGARSVAAMDDDAWTSVTLEVVPDDAGLLTVWMLPRYEPPRSRGRLGLGTPGSWLIRSLRFEPDRANEAGPGTVAVVIPTYNRQDCLLRTLDALVAQSHPPDEVVVVDDGSTDGTWDRLMQWAPDGELPFRLLRLRQENAGPAVARNRGVQAARSTLIAFLGDDTVPAPDWLAQHFACHAKEGPGCAVVGYTGWDAAAMKVTPFLRYINGCGAQFGYDLMPDGQEVPFTCFYTSNLSLPREYLLAEPFDKVFTAAGWEDAEVGYRLSRRGMRIIYRAAARTQHRHPTTVTSFMARQVLIGRICPTLLTLHPELTARYDVQESPGLKLFVALGCIGRGLLPLVAGLDRLRIPLPQTLYRLYLAWYYIRGLRAAKREAT